MDLDDGEAQLDLGVQTELLPLTAMISKMFTQDFVDYIKEKYGSLRKFYETSSATTQCHNTIKPEVRNVTKCWICGFVIPDTKNPEDAFYPECEHIFPIAQAIFFIGLYNSEVKGNRVFVKKLELEYGWAHRVCNQIKSDTHFIVNNTETSDGRWKIDDNKIRDFLNDILQRGNTYGGGANWLKQQMKMNGMSREKWIDKQSIEINRKCQALIDTIPPKYENLWMLTTVSDLALLYQNSGFVPEIIEPYDTIAQSGVFVHYNPQEVIRVYTDLAKYIMKNVQKYMITYLAERIGARSTPLEEKAHRSNKANEMLKHAELISKIRENHLAEIYNIIPNNINKQPRFVEAIQYLIMSVLLERTGRIFTAPNDYHSQPLHKLGSELRTNLANTVEIWTNRGLAGGIERMNTILSTSLKGASRRR